MNEEGFTNQLSGIYKHDGRKYEDIYRYHQLVDKKYRTVQNKSERAIAGLSMGGFHSFHISRYYPNSFDYVGLFSAAIMPNENAKSSVYKNIEDTLLKQKQNGYKLYWIGIGKDDFLYPANTDLRKKLDGMNFKYVYRESSGHTWRNWRVYLSEFLPLLFNQ